MTSNLSAFPYFQEREEATPAAFNDKLSIISANIAAVGSQFTISPPSGNTVSISTNLEVIGGAHFQHLSIGSTPPSYSTTAAVTIEVNSAYSDYLYLVDSSAQKSSYIIGSRAGNLADGLNIWDASAGTMIASFSKQSIRFFQNVVGPVFDVGGALANTLNAATFGTGADSKESRIQAAISAASIAGIARVYVPANMYPYSAGSVSFDTRVQMVREGGNWDHYDVFAYGAAGNGVANDTNAIQSVFSYAIWDARPTGTGVEVFFPAGRYSVNTTITIVNRESFVIRGVGTKGSRWEWSGISGIPMLKMTNVGRGQFIDLAFWGQGGTPPDAAIQVHRDSGLTITSARFMSFSGVQVGQGATNNMRTGIRFTAAAGFDVNNDNAKFLDCAFVSCSSAGLSFEHSQAKGHAIIACKFSTCGRAVATSLGTNPSTPQGGSFWCSNCQLTDSSIADWDLGRPNDAILIYGCNTEGANRWISTTTTTGIEWPLTIVGTRFANNGLNADGSGISFGNRGPVTMIGCQYPSDENGVIPVVRVAGNSTATGLNAFIAIGSSFLTSTPYTWDGTNQNFIEMLGNTYFDGNQYLPIPSILDLGTIRPVISQSTLSLQGDITWARANGGTALALQCNASMVTLFNQATANAGFGVSAGTGFTGILGVGVKGATPFQIWSSSAGRADLLVSGRNTAFLFAQPGGGSPGDAMSVGVNDNSGVGVFQNTGDATIKGIVVRGKAGQTADLFQVQDSGSVVMASITSLGQSRFTDGTALAPSHSFTSETSLGLYRSGISTMAASYGTLNLATNAVRLSMRTVTSMDSTTLATNEVSFSIAPGSSGASLGIRSGGTIYFFASSASTKG